MRKRVGAIIIEKEKVLLMKRIKPEVIYWTIPGGGVEVGETLERATKRECFEELGVNVKVKELALEMDSKKPGAEGQREYFYFCEITSGKVGEGKGPEFEPGTDDFGTYEVEWVKISDLEKIDLKPEEIKKLIVGFDMKK